MEEDDILSTDAVPASALEVGDDGRARINATVMKCGVLPYKRQRPDGTTYFRHELKSPSEFQSDAFLRTMRGAYVVKGHPIEGKVTPSNVKQVIVGYGGDNPTVSNDGIDVGLTVFDPDAIQSIRSKETRHVSLGVMHKIVETSGIWRGIDGKQAPVKYDAVHVEPRVNHIALVPKGRAAYRDGAPGTRADVVLHLDSAVELETAEESSMDEEEEKALDSAPAAATSEAATTEQTPAAQAPTPAPLAETPSKPEYSLTDRVGFVAEVHAAAPTLSLDMLSKSEIDDMYKAGLAALKVEVSTDGSVPALQAAFRTAAQFIAKAASKASAQEIFTGDSAKVNTKNTELNDRLAKAAKRGRRKL